MTRTTCPSCRLRFGAAAAATLYSCPECGRSLEAVASPAAALGFRLFVAADPYAPLPITVEAALPRDDLRPDRP
jgi:hypothetical protein